MHNTIQQQMLWRYATKIFIPGKQISQETREAIIEAGRMAPTAYGLQPFSLIAVTDGALREKIKTEAGYNQSQITDAGDLFIIARRTDLNDAFIDAYIENIVHTRGVDTASLEGFRTVMKGDILNRNEEAKATWAGRQAYIAFGAMIETAALLEVDACPMEGFDPKKLDEILGLSEKNLASLGLLAIGYRGEGDYYATAPKVRTSKESFILTY